MLLVLLSFLSLTLSFGQETVGGGGGSPSHLSNEQVRQALRPVLGKNKVEQELKCLREKMNARLGHQSLLRSEESLQMIELVSTGMQASFDKFKMNDPHERAYFYAQIVAETAGFTKLTETTNHRPAEALTAFESNDPRAAGNALITQVIEEDVQNDNFSNVSASGSRGYGEYRGKGLIHLSGCDNYMSAIHYLNQFYAGQRPDMINWRSYWTYNDKGTTKQVMPKGTCDERTMPMIESGYRQLNALHGYELNLYGAFRTPGRIARVGASLQSEQDATKKIDSVEFMTDVALAYYRGRCGEIAQNIPTIASVNRCHATRESGDKWYENANRCLTKCVQGSTSDANRRLAYTEEALACMNISINDPPVSMPAE